MLIYIFLFTEELLLTAKGLYNKRLCETLHHQ